MGVETRIKRAAYIAGITQHRTSRAYPRQRASGVRRQSYATNVRSQLPPPRRGDGGERFNISESRIDLSIGD